MMIMGNNTMGKDYYPRQEENNSFDFNDLSQLSASFREYS